MLTLSANNLSKWRDHFCVLSNVDFHISAGEGLWIRGDNGAGKTSLLRILAGLSKPDGGVIKWNDQELGLDGTHEHESSYRDSLHYISHQISLISHLTVLESVETLFPLMGANAKSDIGLSLSDAGLAGLEHQTVSTLSAGQKQRLSLLRLLIRNKPLWILDEPFSHLDISGRQWLEHILSKHLQSNGLAVIVTHAETLQIPNLRVLELGVG